MKKRWLLAALLALGFAFLLTGCIDANIVGKTYKVTFISEGEEYDSADAALGSRVVFPETPPTKEDDETYTYTFKGWSLTEGEDAKPVESHIVVGDVTFYAVFTREEKDSEDVYFSVSFKDGVTGEKIGEDQKVKEGEDATLPTPPQHTGYTFEKWDRSHTNITAKTEITAVYTKNKYRLTKNYLGETKDESVEFESALALTAPEGVDPVFVFEGWYWDKNYDTPVETGDKMPADNAEIFAKYSVDFSGAEISTEGDLIYGKGDDFALVSDLKNTEEESIVYTFVWNDGSAHEKFTLRNAGEYKLSVTVTAVYGENVLTDTQEFSKTVTVEKAALSVTVGLGADSVVYGTASAPFVTYGDFQYEDSQTSLDLHPRYTYTEKDGIPVAGNKLGVGTYSVVAEFAEPDNYVLDVTAASLTVTPKDLTVTVSAENFVYGEISDILLILDLSFDGFANGDSETSLGGAADYSYTKNGKPFTAEGLFGAGEYTVSVQGFTSENYKISYAGAASFIVSKREATAVLTAKGGIYGTDPEYNVKFTGILKEDESLFVPEYTFTKDGEAYQPSGLFGAGKYEVTACFDANENYELNVDAAEFTVEKAELQIGVKVPSIVYGEKPNPEITYDGFIEGENENVLSGTAVYAYTKDGEVHDSSARFVAGSYTVSVSGLTSENYAIAFAAEENFEVAKKDLTLKVSVEKTSLVYGEKPVEKITYEGFVYGENMSDIGNPRAVFKNSEDVVVSDNVFHVGNYIATVEAQSENYDILVNETPFTVIKKDLTATVSLRQSSLTYGDLPEASVAYEGFISESEEEQQTKNVVFAYAQGDQSFDGSQLAVGKYVVSLEGLELPDYNVHVETAELTVSKKSLTVGVTADKSSYVYGETPELVLSFGEFAYGEDEKVLAGGSLSVSRDESPYEDEKFIVGNYTAKAVGFTAENYDIEMSGIGFTVAPKEVTVTVSAERDVYTFGDKVIVSTSVSSLAFDEPESILGDMTIVYTKDGAAYTPAALFNAGEYTATIENLFNENYDITIDSASFTVEKQVFAVERSDNQKSGIKWTFGPRFAEGSPFVFEGIVRLKSTKQGTYMATDESSFAQHFEWESGSYQIFYQNTDVTADFEISYNLKVTLVDSNFGDGVILEPSETTKTYDGKAHEFEVTVQGVAAAVEYSINDGEFTTAVPSLTDAGTYKISYKVSAENYVPVDGDFEVTILKAENHIDYSGIGTTQFTYNGQDHTVDFAKATATNGTVAVSGETVFKDAGEYTVTLSVAESENYKAVSVEVTVKVAKADYEIVAENQSYVYTGSAQGRAITVKAIGEDTYTVSYNNADVVPVLTNVGSVTVNYTVSGNDNYNDAKGTYDLSVTKAPNSIDVSSVTGTEWTYDGTEHTIDLSGVSAKFGKVTSDNRAFIDAGTYTVTVTVAGTDNYEGATATIEVVVHKAELTVTPQENNFTFNAQKQGNGVKVEALDNGYTIEYTYSDKKSDTVPQFTDAGSYTVGYRVFGANYIEKSGPYTVTIAPKELTVTNPEIQSKTYDGTEFDVGITVTGNVAKQYTVTYTVNGEPFGGTLAFVDAGTYEITYTVSGKNYKSDNGGYTITITKAQGTIDTSAVQTEYTYNGEEQVVDLSGVKWTGDGVRSNTENKFTGIPENGTFVITLTLAEGKNYFGETQDITITVNKADYEGKTHPEISEVMGVGKTLGSITLDEYFTWKEPSRELALGNNQYDAVYNADPKNYNDFALKITINARREKVTIAVDPLEANFGATEIPDYSSKYVLYDEDGERITDKALPSLNPVLKNTSTNANFKIGSTYYVLFVVESYDAENQYYELTNLETETAFKLKSVDVGDTLYTIEDALALATTGNVIVKHDTAFASAKTLSKFAGLYSASNYEVKAGVTLLIPYNNTDTGDTGKTEKGFAAVKVNSAFATLIISNGTRLSVNGKLIVNGVRVTNSNPTSSIHSDKYSQMQVEENATVIINSGAIFESIGFSYGEGLIIAKNGSKVYEPFNMPGWKGGQISSAIKNTVFPINQYSISSIICKIQFETGVNYYVKGCLTVSILSPKMDILFMSDNSNAFMQLTEGHIFKWIDESSGIIHFDVQGNLTFNNLILSAFGASFSTKGLQVPIPGNFNITITSGNTIVPANVGLKLLPATKLIVEKDATLEVIGNLYAYGQNGVEYDGITEWKDGTLSQNVYPNSYLKSVYRIVPTISYSAATPAQVIIKGTLFIREGAVFAVEITGDSTSLLYIEENATLKGSLKEDNMVYDADATFFTSVITTVGKIDGVDGTPLTAGNYTYTESGWVVAV